MINSLKAIIAALLILLCIPQAPAAAGGSLNLKTALPQTGYLPILQPGGAAVDSALNIYMADLTTNRILKISYSTGAVLASWGGAGSGNGQFNQPMGLAVDSTGNVYVADSGNNRIQKFTYNTTSGAYTYAAQWDGAASGYPLNSPSGLTVDSSGNVYVADTNNHRIQKFDSSGNYLRQWGSYGSDNGEFNQPRGVAVDGSGNLYVADTGNDRSRSSPLLPALGPCWALRAAATGNSQLPEVWRWTAPAVSLWRIPAIIGGRPSTPPSTPGIRGAAVAAGWGSITALKGSRCTAFSSTGVVVADTNNARIQKYNYWFYSGPTATYLGQLGSRGSGNGQFNQPRGLAVDSAGNVYVADSGNNRIQKFSYDPGSGTYAYAAQWGGSGSGAGQFSSPGGVAVDGAGNIFVADTGNNRIQKYTFLTSSWGNFGFGATQSGPNGVAVDSAGDVYVADSGNNRIQKFDHVDGQLARPMGLWRPRHRGLFFPHQRGGGPRRQRLCDGFQ